MAVNTTIARIDGIIRLRTGLAGYNLKDPNLDPRRLTFDSGWRNALRLKESKVVAGADLDLATTNYPLPPGNTGTRTARVIDAPGTGPFRPSLVWALAGAGSLNFYAAGALTSAPPASVPYQKGYRICSVTLVNNALHVTPSYSNRNYAYLIFGTNPTAFEAPGANGARFGMHPLYGMGAFISRPGFNHLTCSLDDMMLSTRRNTLQIHETGSAVVTKYTGGGVRWSYDNASGEPFGGGGTACVRVTLRGSYPDYPPVVVFRDDILPQGRLPAIYWLSPTEIMITGMDADEAVRYAVLAVDPAYQGGTDTGRVRRIRFFDGSLDITKHNVDWGSAGAAGFLFRSSRQTPYFNDFGAFPTTFPTGPYNLPTPAPAGAGPPFTFFMANEPYGGWWCGLGFVDMQDIVGSTGPYESFFRGAVFSRTQYRWWKNATVSVTPTGWASTMNVSDF